MSKPHDVTLVTAEFKKDDLRSFFHLLVGKPDSTLKVFDGPFELSLASVDNLNQQIEAKLKTHSIEAITTSAVVSFDDKTIKEFASLDALLTYQWNGPEKTAEITLRWDFLVSIPNFQMPQRHTLTFCAGRGPHPSDVFRLLFERRDEEEPFDIALVPAYCRVNFINPMLGKELINLVTDWHAGLRRPLIVSSFLRYLRDHRYSINHVIAYSTPITFGLLCTGIFRWLLSALDPSAPVVTATFEKFGLWLAFSIGAVFVGTMAGRVLGIKSATHLEKITIGKTTFCFTNGDSNALLVEVAKNNKHFRNFCLSSAWAIITNIIAAYLAFHFGIGTQ